MEHEISLGELLRRKLELKTIMNIGSSIVGISMSDGRVCALHHKDGQVDRRWVELARDLVAMLPENPVACIKIVRKVSDFGLKEAKDLCDLFKAGNEATIALELGRNGSWRVERCDHCLHTSWKRDHYMYDERHALEA